MPATADLTYRYDGTLEGFYCCVFESYAAHELPLAIRGPFDPEQSLFAVKEIPTDPERAERVARSLPVQLGREAEELCRLTFLTCLPENAAMRRLAAKFEADLVGGYADIEGAIATGGPTPFTILDEALDNAKGFATMALSIQKSFWPTALLSRVPGA